MDLKTLQNSHDIKKWLADKTTVAVLIHLRAKCQFIGRGRPSDANVVVNNEGAIQGWFAALDRIDELGTPVSQAQKPDWQPYQKTAFPEPPNPTQPTK